MSFPLSLPTNERRARASRAAGAFGHSTSSRAAAREDGNPHLFIGGKKGRPLSNMAMLELLRGMRPGVSVQGFRSSFKDWASEATHTPNVVSEAALAHIVADKTEAAYRRGDLLAKRRKLMAEWAAEIVPLRAVQ